MTKEYSHYRTLHYRIELFFDREDQVWFIRYPELPGCLAHASTKEEAIANGEEMKSLWLKMALEHGDTIPEPQ